MSSSGHSFGIVIPKSYKLSSLARISDTISAQHDILFARPIPTDAHTCPTIPSWDSPDIYTRDLINYPTDNLPSGGNCNTGSVIRISPSEMVMSALQLYGNYNLISVTFTWSNKDTGAILYTYTSSVSGNNPYFWSFVGHFSWEIVYAGNYQVNIETPYGSSIIDFTVTDTRPPPTYNVAPYIIKSIASQQPPSNVQVMCLYENKESLGYKKGMARFVGMRYDPATAACNADLSNAKITCINPTKSLLNKEIANVSASSYFGSACIASYGCISGDNCINGTCLDFGAINNFISYKYNFPVVIYNTTIPEAPTGLSVVVGNGSITINWNSVTDPVGGTVFAYYISVTKQGDTIPTELGYVDGTTITIRNLINDSTYNINISAISNNNISSLASTTTATPIGAPLPQVYNIYTTPTTLIIGEQYTITAEITNTGSVGNVRAVFTINGTQVSEQVKSNLEKYPPIIWSPVTPSQTTPSTSTTITVDAYGWSGTAWSLNHTQSININPTIPTCSGITLTPYTLTVYSGDIVNFTASVTPITYPYVVEYRLRDNTLLGTVTSSNGSASFQWNTVGYSIGTYYVKSTVQGQTCYSTESTIIINAQCNPLSCSLTII